MEFLGGLLWHERIGIYEGRSAKTEKKTLNLELGSYSSEVSIFYVKN